MREVPEIQVKQVLEKKIDKTRTWKDPKGDSITIMIVGTYESVIVFCPKCKKYYQLSKKEIDDLP